MVFHEANGFSSRWFRLAGDRFESQLSVADPMRATFMAMTAEVVQMRLREYKTAHHYVEDVVPFTTRTARPTTSSSPWRLGLRELLVHRGRCRRSRCASRTRAGTRSC